MKAFKITGAVLLALAVVFSLGLITASAASDQPGSSPSNAPYLDNTQHPIGANAEAWYRFDYVINNDTGEHPVTTLVLRSGNKSGVGFEVWAPEQLSGLAGAETEADRPKPVGRGMAQAVDCTTGAFAQGGGCLSDDLMWVGAFGAQGTYFVRVFNSTPAPSSYLVTVKGSGVVLSSQTGSRSPAAAPAASAANSGANMDDPGRAAVIASGSQSIPANSAIWYRFDYDAVDHPTKTITLVNGANSGVKFEVWSAENLQSWWDNKPIGKGTTTTIDCDTGAISASGGCQSSNLVWSGAFGATGTYYVRIINGNAAPANVQLMIQ